MVLIGKELLNKIKIMEKGKEEEIKKITKLSIRDVWRIEEDFTRWLEKNIDKVRKLKQTPEYQQKNREQALASYHRRKAKEKTVEKLIV